MNVFCRWLHEQVKERNISQGKLADRMNKTQAQVCNWMYEKQIPRINTVEEALAEVGYHIEIVKDRPEIEKIELVYDPKIAEEYRREHPELYPPVEPEVEGGGSTWWYVCGECHASVNPGDEKCGCCKRRLIWERKQKTK